MSQVVDRFLARLQEIEEASELTQKDASKKGGRTAAMVGHWKRGRSKPTLESAEKYVTGLGGELVIDILHPNGGRVHLLATKDGAVAARLVDSFDDEDRALVLDLLQAIPEHREHRETIRGMLRDVVRALRALKGGIA
jgi:transcriptional regulator with XRE-family HTH domain